MTRSEASGLSIAVIGHVLLFGLLSATFFANPVPLIPKPESVEVSLVGDVGLHSEAPVVSSEPMAAKLSPVEAPVEPEPAPPEPVVEPDPQPVAKPEPKPVPAKPRPDPKAVQRPTERPRTSTPPTAKPPTTRPVKPTGNLDGLDVGKSNNKTSSTSTTPPAAVAGPDQKASINAAIRRQLKPHWRSPTGADVESLRTIIELQLNRDGSLAAEPRLVRQDGKSASNRAQQDLHVEQAIKAIKLAAPFKDLPPEYYDYWKRTGPAFDRRLSQ